ncbi:MAG: transglycosylase SLT domain-containing protein [Spirochaetes bacterium]|nr:transglycosylase SLT domain-containing protein [Spirochaetota bacterium]
MKHVMVMAGMMSLISGMLTAQTATLNKIKDRTTTVKQGIEDKSAAHEALIADKFTRLEKRIKLIWDKIDKTTRFDYVDYSEDAKQKTKVAFEEGFVMVEVIDSAKQENKQVMLANIDSRIKEARRDKDPAGIQYLKDQVADTDVSAAKPVRTVYTAADGEAKVKYSVSVPLKKDSMVKRAEQYLPIVLQYSQKHGIPADLTLAIIETESAFNPYSDNGIAYGLMQLVPDSASDASKTAYGTKRAYSIPQLKHPETSIALGTALLNQFYTWKAYFAPFEQYSYKHQMMGVAGYNCGPNRVRRWIDANKGMLNASDAVFLKSLTAAVPYETQRYLVKIPDRRPKYAALVAAAR